VHKYQELEEVNVGEFDWIFSGYVLLAGLPDLSKRRKNINGTILIALILIAF